MNVRSARYRRPQRSPIVLGALVVFVVSGVTYGYFAHRSTSFSQMVWCLGETAAFSQDAPRLRMADGLVASRALLGKSAQEVASMLGPPTRTDKFKNYNLVYWLGAERGFLSIDSEWLLVRFDNEKVVEANIVRD
jgi:hypothetical protein